MLDIVEHKFYLVNILKDIYSNASIRSLLCVKGGTASYLFHGLPRFSVDMDFNLLDPKKEDLVFSTIRRIVENYGELKDKRKKQFTIFFLLSYKPDKQNVKIEISRRIFPDNYEVKSYLGISMLVMVREDIFAHKLVALLDRKTIATRDLFDIWFFTKNRWDVNKNLVEFRTNMHFDEYLKKCIKTIERFDDRYILQGLGELLDEKQKGWARKNLKKELLFLLKYYSENL